MDWREGRGHRIDHDTFDFIPQSEGIRCLRDQIVVETLEWRPSQIVEVVYFGKPLRGRVLAVGPGCYPKNYDGPKGRRTKMWESKAFRPTDVKIGEVVELGGLELGGYIGFTTFRWGQKQCLMCREEDVTGVVDGQ